jgi:hypothetical protein
MENKEEKTVDPKTLQSVEFDFYGVDLTTFCIGANGERRAYEVVEDANDGYRSSMENVVEVHVGSRVFSAVPFARVTMQEAAANESFDWKLVGTDGYTWVEFGTDAMDDYYPIFVFNYHPRVP